MGVAWFIRSSTLALFVGLVGSLLVAWGGAAYQYNLRPGIDHGHWDKDKCFYSGERTFACDRYSLVFPSCGNDPVPPPERWPPQFLRDQRERTEGGKRRWNDRLVAAGWPRRCVIGGARSARTTKLVFEDETVVITPSIQLEDYVDREDFLALESEHAWTGRQAIVLDHHEHMTPHGFPRQEVLALPYRPIWSGLATNTALFGGVWWLAIPARRGARRALRSRRGRCTACGYDLAGDPDAGCPECGLGLEPAAPQQ